MPIIFDEVSVDVQPAVPAPAVTALPESPNNTQPIDPQALANALAIQSERAARLYAD